MHWYLIHTKPRQEESALINLERQGYECYLPRQCAERLQREAIQVVHEPLFPRYLFIRLGLGLDSRSWSPVRSTKGVSRLVSFGGDPARVDGRLIDLLRSQEEVIQHDPERLYKRGEHVCLTAGPFAGVEGVFQMLDGERRVVVLIELLSKQLQVTVVPTGLRKVG